MSGKKTGPNLAQQSGPGSSRISVSYGKPHEHYDGDAIAVDLILRVQAALAKIRQSVLILSYRDVVFPLTIDQTTSAALRELEACEWYLTNPTVFPGSILIPEEMQTHLPMIEASEVS